MKKHLTLLVVSLLITLQANSRVVLYIKEALRIGATSTVYVRGSMRSVNQSSTANVTLNGKLVLGNTFVQDAQNPVFTDNSNGTVSFSDMDNVTTSRTRTRTLTSETLSTFDRSNRYIAFPNIEINTTDVIKLPHRMGMDAKSITRIKSGKLYLESQVETDRIYDASLRMTSSAAVPLGAVVVEKDVTPFRSYTEKIGLIPFASPFKDTQKSGYFAGNWVRQFLPEGHNGHVRYVYANGVAPAPNPNYYIDFDHYVTNPSINLIGAKPYLLKFRDFNTFKEFQNDYAGLGITAGNVDAGDYIINKFVFNGHVFNLQPEGNFEQLFNDNDLGTYTITSNPGTTINWVMGNSYTAPISVDKLAEAASSSTLKFSNYIYVFNPGSQSYEVIKLNTENNSIITTGLREIPAMSVFMLRVSNSNTATGTFQVTRDMLVHSGSSLLKTVAAPGSKASNVPQSPIVNQVNLRVTPENNNFIYDVTTVGLREDASYGADSHDIPALPISSDNSFMIYTQSSSGSKLTINGIPVDAESVDIYFQAAAIEGNYKLTVSNQESLQTEGAWLEDLLTGSVINLNENSEYIFTASPSDDAKRFILRFKSSEKSNTATGIYSYYANEIIKIKNLNKKDLGAAITIYDIQGHLITDKVYVDTYPQMILPARYAKGVYIIRIDGSRNYSSKFIVK